MEIDTQETVENSVGLEADARALAETQRDLKRASPLEIHVFGPESVAGRLERVQAYLNESSLSDPTLQAAAAWFLDNYYLIRRVARQAEEDLPRGFARHLLRLASGPEKGRPRIEVLAQTYVAKSDVRLDPAGLRRFIDAYQELSPLTIAELWAFPTMLRVTVLEHLLAFLQELGVPTHRPSREARSVASISLKPGAGAELSIRALRMLDAIDWTIFFEKTNRVEAILRSDPTRRYAAMDFETRDSYRKVIEELAWTTKNNEEDVADLALALARERASDKRAGLVGYYLIAEGRRELETRLGYRAIGLERVRRAVLRWPTISYLLPLAVLSCLPVLAALWFLLRTMEHASLLVIVVAVAIATVPASAFAVSLLNRFFAYLVPPRTLPKLDFKKGIPRDIKTLVVMPTLLGRMQDVGAMLRQIEIHYLSNPDPQLQFALLTDDVDTKAPLHPSDEEVLLESAAHGIAALNVKHARDGTGPFHLLHRRAQWNPAEQCFMGWERKRGKLEELNRLLRGNKDTSYSRHVGDPEGLVGIRFVITLDSDTDLPMGSARRLVGLLAHPLNQAVFDSQTGRVIAGYTIVQPRIETSPSSRRQTLFSRLFSGDVGFDIYSHACSDIYQDLFGAGSYVGKGIYDVDTFMRSVEGRVPENSLVSHDLFEGIHGRTALATDIVLFESYPDSYATYANRMHRWVRGDWQLLPWLFSKVPSARGERLTNKLSLIDQWKVADNLRRSLMSPLVLLLLVLGWIWPARGTWAWTIGVLGLLLAPSLLALITSRRRQTEILGRAALTVVFLMHEAFVVVDAIIRVNVRRAITRKNMLQWTSAAHASFAIAARSPRAVYWQTMIASPILALAVAALVATVRPSALVVAVPLLAIWLVAPEIARWISKPKPFRSEHVTDSERKTLRMLARRTWRFFDKFVGPNDQWLPIDNYQEAPHEQTAHRTSPTNIGLSMLATLSAYDFGYIGPSELSLRIRGAFDAIARMTHYQGHLFNWYDTRSLQPLLPRYVSTVDSGNFAGCLIALKQGCKDVAAAPVVRAVTWDGLLDSIDLLEQVVELAPRSAVDPLRSIIAHLRRVMANGRDNLGDCYAALRELCNESADVLDGALLAFLETGAHRHEADLLHALRTSIDGLHQQLRQMRREFDALVPWLALKDDAAAFGINLPVTLRLQEIPIVSKRLRLDLEIQQAQRRALGEPGPDLDASRKRLDDAFRSAELNAQALLGVFDTLAARADDEMRGMDFKLLYDGEQNLFHIGYNATNDQIDAHHYDLLASEARLASYIAIVKRDVPVLHWYALGRPLTLLNGIPALLSWGGTMFEYLMSGLLMRSQEGTQLARTSAAVVDAQIAYGEKGGVPWGISESAFAQVDADQTYQYRSFGVPGLGFKRGLEEDQVITPHASILAVSIRPRAVVANVAVLESMGMMGTYGFFEALDLTPTRARGASGRPETIVRSYMAHHQGMLLVALGNYLNSRSMVDRFHSHTLIETGEALLNERPPDSIPLEWPMAKGSKIENNATAEATPGSAYAWPAPSQAGPQAHVLSNGSMTSLVTAAGGGGLRWHGLALTRYEVDATRDADGLWLYLRDEESGRLWLATSTESRTTYCAHKAELHLRNEGISAHVDITVAATDDVEVRLVTLHNETARPRQLTVTSAGRPVLFDAEKAPIHPAFSSMFIESERLVDLDAILFARRPHTADEKPVVLVHRIVRQGSAVVFGGYESDRGAFFGRGGSLRAPAALSRAEVGGEGLVGAVIDPIMSLTARIELPPKGSATFAFVTTVGRSRGVAVDLARKYGSMHAVSWAFRDAAQESPRRLQRAKLEPELLPVVQRLFSALLFANPALRASSSARAATPPSQPRLWGHGISGDNPIVLVRVEDPEAPILREMFVAQRYLRTCGVRLDLVLIDEQGTGYFTEGSGTLLNQLALNDLEDWRDRHGGVFVIAVDQAPEGEILHLEACARVLLDTRDHTLASRLERVVESPPRLPQFEATRANAATLQPRPRPSLLFDNGTGGFSEDGREYVIDVLPGKPTPAPWCNVLANPDFGCLVSESSFGVTWSLNSGENRLTPWRNDPVLDTPSEALYMRDEETAEIWSPTPLPAGQDWQTRVRHGAGYTTYERESHDLVQELTVFVPPGAPLKIVRLRVKNKLERHRRLTATYYAEWVLGKRREDQRPHIVSQFDQSHACLLATSSWNADFGGRVAFLASKNTVHGFTADRTEFLGRDGDYARPKGLGRWGLSGRVDLGADPCAALQVHLELAPHEQLETHFVLGQSANREEALRLVARYRDGAAVEAAWNELHGFWDEVLGSVRVKTPEPSMDLMLNRWLLYQTLTSRIFGRTGFYQSSGAFGYRDQLQDVLALLISAPARARAHILEAAKHQFEEGDVLHWWHPPSGRGVRTRCSDDMAWLPYATSEYVAATGDTGILDEPVPFLQGEPLGPDEHDRYASYKSSTSSAPLFEHCRRAIERAVTEGAHGLPLMGDGDWNDAMSRVGSQGRGESVWLGWFLCTTMDRFAALSVRRGDDDLASKWRDRAALLRVKMADSAWDGAWYLRAFHDDGSLVGSAKSHECRIDSIVQSWAVLSRENSDATDSELARMRAAVRAVDEQLVRDADRLVLLFWPPFNSTLHDPGYVRAYPPGIRENGGQYTHAATWLGFAHSQLGDGQSAERIFGLLNPVLRARTAEDSERYRVEPYALAADVYSCAPWVGRGGWTWYTGSAAWMWRLGVEAILGLRKQGGQLRIDPCIPPSWTGFEAWVRLGKRVVHVVVENPDRVATGVAATTLDGVKLEENRITLDPSTPGTHEVSVRLGLTGTAPVSP